MTNQARAHLVAPCGIDCAVCELYLCKDSPELFAYLLSKGIPQNKLPCKGCRESAGGCPVIGGACETYACVQQKQVAYCCDCGSFPCAKIQPCADRAETLPHNLKAFNLAMIKNQGIEQFVEQSARLKQTYYKGKMAVGKGPQVVAE